MTDWNKIKEKEFDDISELLKHYDYSTHRESPMPYRSGPVKFQGIPIQSTFNLLPEGRGRIATLTMLFQWKKFNGTKMPVRGERSRIIPGILKSELNIKMPLVQLCNTLIQTYKELGSFVTVGAEYTQDQDYLDVKYLRFPQANFEFDLE